VKVEEFVCCGRSVWKEIGKKENAMMGKGESQKKAKTPVCVSNREVNRSIPP
jgi:hypothetical protein